METYRLTEMNGFETICTFTKDEIKAILLDDEKIDFRKIGTGYAKAVKINGDWYRISRK